MAYCPSCGRAHASGFAECAFCGIPLSTTPPSAAVLDRSERRSLASVVRWILTGTAVGALFGGAVSSIILGTAAAYASREGVPPVLWYEWLLIFALGVPYGAVPGFAGGVLAAALCMGIEPPGARRMAAAGLGAAVGLATGAVLSGITQPTMLLTLILGAIAGCMTAALVDRTGGGAPDHAKGSLSAGQAPPEVVKPSAD